MGKSWRQSNKERLGPKTNVRPSGPHKQKDRHRYVDGWDEEDYYNDYTSGLTELERMELNAQEYYEHNTLRQSSKDI
jgi:hypothetical protein